MRFLILLAPIVLPLPLPLHAQDSSPRLEVGGELSRWHLDSGGASSAGLRQTSGTLRLGLVMPTRAPTLFQLGATYAPNDDRRPGLFGVEAEVAPRLLRTGVSGSNVFVSLGAGAIRFTSPDRDDERLAECRADPFCFAEGPTYHPGWRVSLNAGVGADLAATGSVMVRPLVQVVRLLGDYDAGLSGERTLTRFGVGVFWRP